jgi:hypothetical protein
MRGILGATQMGSRVIVVVGEKNKGLDKIPLNQHVISEVGCLLYLATMYCTILINLSPM